MKARGQKTPDALVELLDMYPTLCELAGLPLPKHLAGRSFVPLLNDPNQKWKTAAISQFPNPALREWAANPLSPGMRQTFFGPLIEDVEKSIIKQQGDQWNRELFENHLMGYSMRTDRYRLVTWRDHRDRKAAPVFVELFDHQTDPTETANVAAAEPAGVRRPPDQTTERNIGRMTKYVANLNPSILATAAISDGPKGQLYVSPGQRPGSAPASSLALKGRP